MIPFSVWDLPQQWEMTKKIRVELVLAKSEHILHTYKSLKLPLVEFLLGN